MLVSLVIMVIQVNKVYQVLLVSVVMKVPQDCRDYLEHLVKEVEEEYKEQQVILEVQVKLDLLVTQVPMVIEETRVNREQMECLDPLDKQEV